MNNEYWGNQPDYNQEQHNPPVYHPQEEQPSYQYPSQPPAPPYNYYGQPSEPEKPKKKSKLPVLLLALAMVIVGGLAGGFGVFFALNHGPDTVVEEVAPPQEVESAVEEAPIKNSVINVVTNATEGNLTPQAVFETYVNAVVAISNEATVTNYFGQVSETASSGSGMILSEDGYILTNNHVVEGAEKLTVTMTSGEEYEAELIGGDSENDVALLKIDGKDLPTVAIGDSGQIQVGEQVCAIGNPLGELTNTLTVGYVSALDREINEGQTPINMFQTDCAINSGNSGGPIFDMDGNVIGITTAKYSNAASTGSASIEGIGFCIPINDAMDIVADLMEYGYVRGRANLGISCQSIPETVTQYYNFPTGIYVVEVEEGSAAEKAGLKSADIITALDGKEATTVAELKKILREYEAGDTVTLTVFRSETLETLELEAVLDEKVVKQEEPEPETVPEESEEPQQPQSGNGVQGGMMTPDDFFRYFFGMG